MGLGGLMTMRWSVEDDTAVVWLSGPLDASSVADLDDLGIVAQAVPKLVVELSAVGSVDADGLHALERLAAAPTVTLQAPSGLLPG